MATPDFPRRDPADPEFWDLRYEARFAPWDAGRVPAQLRSMADAEEHPPRVLVPGCGSAWDVRHLAERGWDVLGIDFSDAALEAARAVLGPHAGRIRKADFFAPIAGEPFGLVYERAFLCALPRRLWRAWGERVAGLVAPGGRLAGFFHFDDAERGPPFGLRGEDELATLLGSAFERITDEPVADSIAVFQGKERWQVWRRLQSGSNSSDCG